MQKSIVISLALMLSAHATWSQAENSNGKGIFVQRCAMCHGTDLKGTGPLANKSQPPTPDLTTAAFKKRLSDYPGVIVSSVVLRPNGDLIPKTLQANGVKLPAFSWRVKDLRDLNQYMAAEITKQR